MTDTTTKDPKPSIAFASFTGPGTMCHKHGTGAAIRIEGIAKPLGERGERLDGYYCGGCFAELIAANCKRVGWLEHPSEAEAA